MRIELAEQEVELLRELLTRELEEGRVEEHHAVNAEFKARVQDRERLAQGLLARLG